MTEKSLKGKAVSGFIWSILDKAGQQGLAFVVGIILARLLSVEDYGLIGVLAIFTAIANILQESGFSAALIQAKEVSQKDYASVFYFNILVSAVIYVLYFFSSPWIAAFYDKEILTNLSRFIFLAFLFNAWGIVQNVQLVKSMNFKQITKINFFSGLFSLIVALFLGFAGYGVWALAAQLVALNFMKTFLLWCFGDWRPMLFFGFQHIRKYLRFSVKLLLATLSATIVGNVLPIVLGRFYSVFKVGFYNQANRYYNFTYEAVTSPVNAVSFPMLAEANNHGRDLKKIFRKTVRFAAFLNFPVMFGIIAIARSFIMGFLGVKWEPSVELLILFCIYGIFAPFPSLFMNLLKTLKLSNKVLYMELIREILVVISIVVCFRWDIYYLLLGVTVANLVHYVYYVRTAGRVIQYTVWEHFRDIGPYFVITLCMALIVMVLYLLPVSFFVLFFIQFAVGGIFYISVNWLLHSTIQSEIWKMIKGYWLRATL